MNDIVQLLASSVAEMRAEPDDEDRRWPTDEHVGRWAWDADGREVCDERR